MSSPEGPEVVSSKPCNNCRKRKVRCDKLRPCANCVRSKQDCIYDTIDSSSAQPRDGVSSSSSGDSELRERLARLEKMMATMMVGEKGGQFSTSQGPNSLNDPAFILQQPQNRQTSSTTNSLLCTTAPVGQIVFQEGEGAYLDADFWPGLISEIEDIRRILDTPQTSDTVSQWTSLSLLGVASVFSSTNLSVAQPSLDESNLLCKFFFQSVNPFIRVLHQSLFARELDQYRRGTYLLPDEFEALLFTIYLLVVNSLRSETVEQYFSVPKETLLARYQYAAQASLTKIDFFKTQRIAGVSALLHYLTFLFQQNTYKDAISLLGVAAGRAQAIGLHRDPTHFPFSPWVCELRRRIWNHVCYLDGVAISSYGAESCLPATSDSKPPQNANDSDWHASRFAKPSSVPMNLIGFKEMSCVLAQREISDTIRTLTKLESNDFATKERTITQTESIIKAKYFRSVESDNPTYAVALALVEMKISNLRLLVSHRTAEAEKSNFELPDPRKQNLFISTLNLLESHENFAKSFTSFNWEWVFETSIPWFPIAILLTQVRNCSEQNDRSRAQNQINRIFSMYADTVASRTPMWKMLLELRKQMQEDATTATQAGAFHSTTVFTDDFMLDFGAIPESQSGMNFEDQVAMQDMQNLPWLGTQARF